VISHGSYADRKRKNDRSKLRVAICGEFLPRKKGRRHKQDKQEFMTANEIAAEGENASGKQRFLVLLPTIKIPADQRSKGEQTGVYRKLWKKNRTHQQKHQYG